MSKKNSNRLGKGLEALLGGNVDGLIDEIENNYTKDEVIQLSLVEISPNPYQPRTNFDEKKISELAQSIKNHGVFTPIIVKKTSSGYTIIAGERRYRASLMLGNKTIPAIVVDFNEKMMMEIALLENIQRENLNPLEEAKALKMIMDENGYTQEEISKQLVKSRSHVANILRLLTLNKKIQDLILNESITMGHAKILIGIEDEDLDYVINEVLENKLSVRECEKLAQDIKKKEFIKKSDREVKVKSNEYLEIEKNIREKLGTKVKLENKSISIYFEDTSDLNRILELLKIEID